MTTREQDHAEAIIREIEHRRAHWYRVRVVLMLLGCGVVLWALVYLLVTLAMGGAQ